MTANTESIPPTMAHDLHKKGPLQLLDLPRDILELIIKEVTYTNDLASLARANSALYSLAAPHIYTRFNIVWPEKQGSADTYAGVDALTYGLSTLVTSGGMIQARKDCCVEEAVGTACSKCSMTKSQANKFSNPRKPLRRLNYLTQYIRRFSIANGPQECIEQYYVSSNCGKMLGTLVALALASMPRLEKFTWDMPTGVLRDVWIALSSLGELKDSRLEMLWMRCPESGLINDGDENLGSTANAMNPARAASRRQQKRSRRPSNYLDVSYLNIESPSFSLLPPMKSITVLKIDEPAYLQELSQAVATSVETLRELRISVVSLFCGVDWAAADRIEVNDKKSTDARLGFFATGGVLGLLMKELYDCRRGPKSTTSSDASRPGSLLQRVGALVLDTSNLQYITGNANDSSHPSTASHQADDVASSEDDDMGNLNADMRKKTPEQLGKIAQSVTKKLRLETLELESVTIRSNVLRHSIQWEHLTSLTLLNCGADERLWKLLISLYGPVNDQTALAQKSISSTDRRKFSKAYRDRQPSPIAKEYRLHLKKIHTNRVSFLLITFLKRALAPNSLEQLFLQETCPPTSKVTIEEIYHGPVRYHRMSLKKLFIDSVHSRNPSMRSGAGPLGNPGDAASKGKKWVMSRKVLSFMTSGKMPELRELAMVVNYKDWHFLLQGLPRIPHLRALYLPHIMNHPYGAGYETLELANQVVNVATLRSEMELTYLAIWQQCFEILEDNGEPPVIEEKVKDGRSSSVDNETLNNENSDEDEDDEDEDDEDEDDEQNDDWESDEDGSAAHDDSSTFTTSESSHSGDDYGEMRSGLQKGKVKVKRLKLKLREILFYDDRVSIFKARHGKL